MSKFLIEVHHDPDQLACAQVVRIFLSTGSHYLTHADWGCTDGEHAAWMIVDVDSKEEARSILPPAFRSKAKIVTLNKFTMEEVEAVIKKYHR